jgi:transcriptional regulator of acetoin/glycerol metabolism
METRSHDVHRARDLFFDRGRVPDSGLAAPVARSWQRCHAGGLAPASKPGCGAVAESLRLRESRERNRLLISHTQPVMAYLYEQICHSDSMVILSDPSGLVLQSIGDTAFISRADRVLLRPGASWDENVCGTNAIGTAVVERRPVEIIGNEHFFDCNAFLTCSASPLFDPHGGLMGVLDISGDCRAYQPHTLGLVKMTAHTVERRIFEASFAGEILIAFHMRPEYVGSLGEGLVALGPDGRVLAMNDAGLAQLGLRRDALPRLSFASIFNESLGGVLDRLGRDPGSLRALRTSSGSTIHLKLRSLPASAEVFPIVPIVNEKPSLPRARGVDKAARGLDSLATGDARLQLAIDRAHRILGRDIPMLVQGESGAGKELFARAFHDSGPRSNGPFVALNCAAIPETLIEAELFGYQGGAFTGARREGAIGKIQQADGGTLFLDEIGDMPLNLQARLLRVLQERCVTPIGSNRTIPVDISLVCATHRRLRDEIQRGNFREDLYYRLNGLCVTLPPLRERDDLRRLVADFVQDEASARAGIGISEAAMVVLERYRWPGNLRQLRNTIRVAVALLDDHETQITPLHLSEELFEDAGATLQGESVGIAAMGAVADVSPLGSTRLDEVELQTIHRVLMEMEGNVSAAARRLGISRNTLYRKIGRM